MKDIKVEASAQRRDPPPAQAGSKQRGRPIADLVSTIEKTAPEVLKDSGLSSAALRAGDLVRAMRKDAGLSQAQLAEKLGISQARISEVESGVGKQGPTWDLMERICEACGKVLSAA